MATASITCSGSRNTAGETWKLLFNRPISSISRQSIKLRRRWLGKCNDSHTVSMDTSEPVSSELRYNTTKRTICKSFNGRNVANSLKASLAHLKNGGVRPNSHTRELIWLKKRKQVNCCNSRRSPSVKCREKISSSGVCSSFSALVTISPPQTVAVNPAVPFLAYFESCFVLIKRFC